jgi:short-subunit dehydrogenase
MKTILVTGAYGGIGAAITRMLAQENSYVIAVGLDKDRLEALQHELSSEKCSAFIANLALHKDTVSLKRGVLSEFESIDWVINSVGFADTNLDFETQSAETIEQTFRVNTFSSIFLTQQFVNHIAPKGGFVHISSMAGINANGRFAVYSASKAAVNNFVQAMARRYPDVFSLVLCPGPTNTSMRERIAKDATEHQNPEVIAETIRRIVCGESDYRSGDIVTILDGIESIHSRVK